MADCTPVHAKLREPPNSAVESVFPGARPETWPSGAPYCRMTPMETPGAGQRGTDETQDGELVRRSLQGDAAAFGVLVRRYERLVFHVAGGFLRDRGEVEDVAQEAFLKAYEALSRFRADASVRPLDRANRDPVVLRPAAGPSATPGGLLGGSVPVRTGRGARARGGWNGHGGCGGESRSGGTRPGDTAAQGPADTDSGGCPGTHGGRGRTSHGLLCACCAPPSAPGATGGAAGRGAAGGWDGIGEMRGGR